MSDHVGLQAPKALLEKFSTDDVDEAISSSKWVELGLHYTGFGATRVSIIILFGYPRPW